jgi:hypothetical protein
MFKIKSEIYIKNRKEKQTEKIKEERDIPGRPPQPSPATTQHH